MDTGIYFEFGTQTTATCEDTILLGSLWEELVLMDKHVERYSRISSNIIRVKLVNFDDAVRATVPLYNKLRYSKNYMAHVCAVTII